MTKAASLVDIEKPCKLTLEPAEALRYQYLKQRKHPTVRTVPLSALHWPSFAGLTGCSESLHLRNALDTTTYRCSGCTAGGFFPRHIPCRRHT